MGCNQTFGGETGTLSEATNTGIQRLSFYPCSTTTNRQFVNFPYDIPDRSNETKAFRFPTKSSRRSLRKRNAIPRLVFRLRI